MLNDLGLAKSIFNLYNEGIIPFKYILSQTPVL